jgi:hypothetical protein
LIIYESFKESDGRQQYSRGLSAHFSQICEQYSQLTNEN